jgi:cell division protein FtsQ
VRRRSWRNEVSVPRRPRRGALRALAWLAALALGLASGALAGDRLLARALPERAAQVRLALLGNRHATPSELAAAAGVGPGVRLAGLDPARVAAGVVSHPWVRSVRVAALPPDRLIVAVEEREPVALAPIGGVSFLVDRSGQAFLAATPGQALPLLIGATARDDARLAVGVAWLEALAAHGIREARGLALADADPARAPALVLPADAAAPGARVLLGSGERDAKLARLARLLASRLPELAGAAEIDLRFGDDVIVRPRPEARVDAEPEAASRAEGAQRANSHVVSNGG